MNASTQAFRGFGIDGAKAHETPERRLNVSSRTAKTVVQIEMAERGVEIDAPHQDNDAAAEPDAFRIAGRAIDGLRGFDELVALALAVFGGISRRGRICRSRLTRLILGAEIAALGESAPKADQQRETGCGEATQEVT